MKLGLLGALIRLAEEKLKMLKNNLLGVVCAGFVLTVMVVVIFAVMEVGRQTPQDLTKQAEDMLVLDTTLAGTEDTSAPFVVKVITGPKYDNEVGLWKTVISLPRGYSGDSYRLVLSSQEPVIKDGQMTVIQRWAKLSAHTVPMFFPK